MRKRSISRIRAVIVISISLLTACGGGDGTGSNNGRELSSGEKRLMLESVKALVFGEKDKKKKKDPTKIDTSVNPSDFEGLYEEKCFSPNKSDKTVTITSDKLVTEINFYKDKECKEFDFKNISVHSLAFLEGTTMTEKGEAIQVDRTNVTLHVSGKLISNNPSLMEDILLLDGKNLYFGKKLNDRGEPIDGRPTEIKPVFHPLVKQ